MKKRLLIALCTITALLCFSCNKERTKEHDDIKDDEVEEVTIDVNKINLSNSDISLTVGETQTLTAVVIPENATNKNISWKSANSSIASVSNGTITAKQVGNTVITVSSDDGCSSSCTVEVKAEIINVTGISLEKTSTSLVEFNKFELNAIVTPEDATDKSITYSSSNEKVASVKNGLITAEGAGNAKITLTTVNGEFSVVFSIYVTNDHRLGNFIDSRDGHSYKTITIGEQVWMAENLAYLPKVNSNDKLSAKDPLYYVYDYTGNNIEEAKKSTNYEMFGVLYNWEAAKVVAPEGWHIATDAEYKTLESHVGMESDFVENAGYRGNISAKLKSTYAWISGTSGTNTSGFNGLPGGYVNIAGTFAMKGQCGDFWTSSDYEDDKARAGDGWERMLFWTHAGVLRTPAHPEMAYSVRCIKD